MSHNVENPFANKEQNDQLPKDIVSPEQVAKAVDFNEDHSVELNAGSTGVQTDKVNGAYTNATDFVQTSHGTIEVSNTGAAAKEAQAEALKAAAQTNKLADAQLAAAEQQFEASRKPSPQQEAQADFEATQGEIATNHSAQQAEINEGLADLDTRVNDNISSLFEGGLDAPERQPEYTNNAAGAA